MIMIRSNARQNMGKPPPPVPPRPSKNVVAQALAKTRHLNKVEIVNENIKSPTRQAPPPPVSGVNSVVKSNSSYTVNAELKKPVVFERSISEEVKNNSRPVIYQSSYVKCNNNNKVQISRKGSDVKIVNRVESFNNNVQIGISRNGSVKKLEIEEGRNRVQISRRGSIKRDSICDEKFVAKYVTIEDGCKDGFKESCISGDGDNKQTKSNENTLEKSRNSSERNVDQAYESSSSTYSSLDKKNWDKMLNDRNHVNTLIDEMFASVLEVEFYEENKAQHSPAVYQTNGLSQDKTKIIVNSEPEIDNVTEKTDNVNNIRSYDSIVIEENVPKTVIVIKSDCVDMDNQKLNEKENSFNSSSSNSAERPKQVKFKDQINHELLINELQCMKIDQDKILKRQRKPSMNIYDNSVVINSEDSPKIQRPDSLDVTGGEREIKVSNFQMTVEDLSDKDENKTFNLDPERITKMSALHGLPPLPKSLSGFNLLDNNPPTPMRSSSIRIMGQPVPPGHLVYSSHSKVNGSGPDQNIQPTGGTSGRKSTNLDSQLAILRREMYSLRQLDLSLLSQLWSLNESIQDFRQILQDQEDRVLSPPSPSPTPSSGEDIDGDEFYMSATSLNFRPAPPPPVARRTSSSSNTSSLG